MTICSLSIAVKLLKIHAFFSDCTLIHCCANRFHQSLN